MKALRFKSLAFVLIGTLALVVGLWEISGGGGVNPAVPIAEERASEIAAATASVYVSLRVINAALSAAQEIEVGGSIGVQASAQPFRVLEPVDDTVERVSHVIFAIAAGAALMLVGLGPVASLGLVLLGIGSLGLAAADVSGSSKIQRSSLRAARLGLAFGLALPLVFAGGSWLGERMTQPQWDSAISQLDAVAGEARVLIGEGDDVEIEVEEEAGGLFSWVGDGVSAAGDAMDAVARYRDAVRLFMNEADVLFSSSLTIIGLFVLRMVVLPALLLWGLMALVRRSIA
ncbi:hypothetical protein [Alterinioella nitratireducens]|uniref:hypothetical protein n=1 Tax=Alterinioella nitratireducens TaxID=2735915 RepID=UPI00155184E1|nr:hypothetical protein [Alterinioella nitratireducens]NPD19440.1 hypothetical protein [Alterinioella nitratireducens]